MTFPRELINNCFAQISPLGQFHFFPLIYLYYLQHIYPLNSLYIYVSCKAIIIWSYLLDIEVECQYKELLFNAQEKPLSAVTEMLHRVPGVWEKFLPFCKVTKHKLVGQNSQETNHIIFCCSCQYLRSAFISVEEQTRSWHGVGGGVCLFRFRVGIMSPMPPNVNPISRY